MRILLTTFGSLGDIHPYIALALELKRRGHIPILATSGFYRPKVEALGIEFRPLRPDQPDLEADPDFMHRMMDLRKGPQNVIEGFIVPVLRETYADTLAAAEGVDLLVSHMLTFATRMVAEQRGLPWVSTMLAPLGFFSAYDPPALAPAPFISRLRFLGPMFYRPLWNMAAWSVRNWTKPIHQFRAEIGLPPAPDPLFAGQHSPKLVLAMFSPLFAQQQRDWPTQTKVTGFPFFDQDGSAELPPELARFLEEGEPPIVFTLGSAAVHAAGAYFQQSAEAAKRLNRRAVLLVGKETKNHLPDLPPGIIACDYAPFSALFPRAAAIVHQSGIGTTGQALQSGRPMLIVPYAHDQADNAERCAKLGVARVLGRRRYSADTAARELGKLLIDSRYANRAHDVGAAIRRETGVKNACDALEQV